MTIGQPFHSSRAPIKAIVFDWAGTTVDFGSLAPVRTLQRVFNEASVLLEDHEARQDMGLPKHDHIAAILTYPSVIERWKERYGGPPTQTDANRLYERFIPQQLSCLEQHSDVIPGVLETVSAMRALGLKIGSTTGYTRAMLDVLLRSAALQGYQPDASVTPEEVGSGRPKPFMLFENARRLSVYPPAALVKVGDTPSDVQEGINAGTWSVGVACTGNTIGIAQTEWEALPANEKDRLRRSAYHSLLAAGAHYVIDSVADLPEVLDHLNVV